jgi:P63C domain-containing protein
VNNNESERREKATVEEAGAKGGKARAEKMSREERQEVGRRGAAKRWHSGLPKATHEGVMEIGIAEIQCAVLDAGNKRVLTQSSFMRALGRSRQAKGRDYYDGDVNLPAFLTAKNLKPYIPKDLEVTSSQIEFMTLSGVRAFGYAAELLPDVCDVFLDAKAAGVLAHNQEHIAEQALMLMRGLARVGIIGLVDEATGFQYDRPRRDLEEYLKKFLSESLRRWVRTFPADYFKHLCRLRGVELRTDMKLPQYFGHLTNNLVYRRIAPGLVRRLKEHRAELGKPSGKLQQCLSVDFGVPEVLVHLGTVVGVMKLHTDYEAFEKQLDTIAPVYPEMPGLFDNPKDWESR